MQKRTKFLVMVTALSVAAGAGLAGAAVIDDSDDDAPISGDALEQATAAALAETGGGEVTETEMEDDEGFYEVEVRMPDGRQIDVHVDKQFKVVSRDVESAAADDDNDLDDADDADEPIAGSDREKAEAAAVAHAGGGEVTETEMEDDEGVYEVEVRMPDGRQMDVHLDENFKVVSDEVESADEDDDNDLDDVNDDQDD